MSGPPSTRRPVVTILVGHYLPGSKGGGPIRSVANLVQALGDEFDFRILARDRDLGDEHAYVGIPTDTWVPVGKAQVRYLSPATYTRSGVTEALLASDPDLVYCQSYFSPLVSILPRILKRRGRLRAPLLVAPRGEFSAGALALKGRKKRLFLALGKRLGLDRNVVWHATAPEEAEDLRRTLGAGIEVLLAPPIPTPDDRPLARREKREGEVEIAFLSRISPKKNLLGAVEIVAGIDGARLTAYGPKEDPEYWAECVVRAEEFGVSLVDGGALKPEAVRPALERAHLLLFPTFGENYGHVVMEAVTAGTPVLLSDRTPWRGLEAEGLGWDLPLENVAAFRDAILAIRASDEKAFTERSQRVYDAATTRRHDPRLVDANRDLFRRALGLDA